MEGYYDRAREAYERLAQAAPRRVEAGLGVVRCALRVGDLDGARARLTELNATDNAHWHLLLSEVNESVGKYEEAIAQRREALRLDARDPEVRYRLARLLESLGRREEALEHYRWFDTQVSRRAELPRDAAWLTCVGQGFLRYSVLTQTDVAMRTRHVLQEMLQPAGSSVDAAYWPARIAAGDLLLEKYNNDEVDGSVSEYKAALRINANLPEAHVGLGAVALSGWQFEEVERRAELALRINPSFAPALYLLGGKLIVERRYEEAIATAERVLAVNPNDVIALSLAAGAHACRYDAAAVERRRERVYAVHAAPANFHRMLGDALGGIRQYEDSEREYRRAIELDPTDANARTELGMMYMQWGHEDRAHEVLEGAWNLDRFNERTKFTLELLERLEAFARHESEHFIVCYNARTDPGLGAYVASYLEEIYPQVTGDYDTELREKTIIEIFPTHRAFGVRITGKPWIHTVGACTGRVIALDAPRRSPELEYGPYNIARVLKHEFTHTVTLAATNNRIPHWLTEGLAVYQEDSPRGYDWSALLAEAVRRGELFTLESIDWGFVRPRKPTDRQQAYAQSEWMVEFIIERSGYDRISELLRAFRDGRTQEQAFSDVLKIDRAAFDRDFAAWATQQASTWGFDLAPPESVTKLRTLAIVTPNDAALLARLARAELSAGAEERALTAARDALKIDQDDRTALDVLLQVLERFTALEHSEVARRAYDDEARRAAERLRGLDPAHAQAVKTLGAVALRGERFDEAVEALEALQRLRPLDPFSWHALAGIHLQRGADDLALPQLLHLARVEEHDAEIPANAARIFLRKARLHDAAYWLRQALLIEPMSAAMHEELAAVEQRTGDYEAALREYVMLTRLEPEQAQYFEQAALTAQRLGRLEETRSFAARAVELNADSPVRVLLERKAGEGP
jgi:tetratricopeptide (TPR) repeat protein